MKNYHKDCKALFKTKAGYRQVYCKWHDMMRRCYNANSLNYKHYGARGIEVCDEWKNEKNGLLNFCKWILSVGFNENKSGRYQSIDRIDNNKGYFPDNCRLVTPSIQNGNKRTQTQTGYKGVLLHSSGTVYYCSVKVNGIIHFIGQSKSKNKCAEMRNEFILKNNLQKPLNQIKPELEDIRPTEIYYFRAYNKKGKLLFQENKMNILAKKVNLCSVFIQRCIRGERISKDYIFEREKKIVYEY